MEKGAEHTTAEDTDQDSGHTGVASENTEYQELDQITSRIL